MRCRGVAIACLALACAREIEGPAPAIAATYNEVQPGSSPATVCNAQGDVSRGWVVDLVGEGFSPLPLRTVSGQVALEMPAVSLAGPETFALPPGRVLFLDPTRLPIALPTADTSPDTTALAPGTYDVIVANPNGRSARAAAALQVVPPPVVTSLGVRTSGGTDTSPDICADHANTLTLRGTGFRPGSATTLSFVSGTTTGYSVPAAQVLVLSSTQIDVALPLNALSSIARGGGASWVAQVNDPDGCVAPYKTGFGTATVDVFTACPGVP